MAKNNQKKEKALRNREYARKFRKKTTTGRGRNSRPGGGQRSAAPAASEGVTPSSNAPAGNAPAGAPNAPANA